MRWPLQPLQPFQQTQLQPPFGQSVDSLCHPWFTTTNVSYRFPILKLPPPPCAVLLVKYGPLRKLLGYLEKAFPSIYMPTRPQVKSFGRHKRWVGWKGCGWPFSGEALILQFKVFFFWTYAEHCCFHLLCHFYCQFSTYPRHTEFNLLYLDFSFSEIGVGPAFHRFTFFLLIPWPSRFLS